MNYDKKEPLAEENTLAEPVATYGVGVDAAAVEPWFDWDNIDGPEEQMVHSYEDFKRKLDEGLADLLAGRVHTTDEVFDSIRRGLETGQWDDN
jgi:hypothetical protein